MQDMGWYREKSVLEARSSAGAQHGSAAVGGDYANGS
jgi:hypothetical protein